MTNFYHVNYINKIAELFAVFAFFPVRTKQFYFSVLFYLIVRMKDHTRHSCFMKFVGPIYIEEFQSRPEWRSRRLLQHPFIKLILRYTIRIKRMQFFNDIVVVLITQFAPA